MQTTKCLQNAVQTVGKRASVNNSMKSRKNPWKYKSNPSVLLEPQKLDWDDVSVLSYRNQCRIKPVNYQEPKQQDDAVYTMFSELVGQSANSMRHWLRCHVLTHKKSVNGFAQEYFKSKGMKLSDWLCSVHTGKRADILALFQLSQITETQCFVHCTCNS